MVEISSYSDEFANQVVDLILTIQRNEFAFDIRAEDQPDLLDITNFYQTGAGGFWVARANGELIGTIALRDIGNRQGALRKMFVKSTHRGKEHAVGLRLLKRLGEHAASARVEELYLGTTEKFVAAHRFYEKNGFALVAAESLPEAFPRMSLDTRFYRKTLMGENTAPTHPADGSPQSVSAPLLQGAGAAFPLSKA